MEITPFHEQDMDLDDISVDLTYTNMIDMYVLEGFPSNWHLIYTSQDAFTEEFHIMVSWQYRNLENDEILKVLPL